MINKIKNFVNKCTEDAAKGFTKIERTIKNKSLSKGKKQQIYKKELPKVVIPISKLVALGLFILCGVSTILYFIWCITGIAISAAVLNTKLLWTTPGNWGIKAVFLAFTVMLILAIYILYLRILLFFAGYKNSQTSELNVEAKTENYNDLNEALFDIFNGAPMAMGILPPIDLVDLQPNGKLFYKKDKTTMYVFTIWKFDDDVNLVKIKRFIEVELRRKLRNGELPVVNSRRVSYHYRIYDPILVMKITQNNEYVKLELTYADKESCKLHEQMKNNMKKGLSRKKADDDDF